MTKRDLIEMLSGVDDYEEVRIFTENQFDEMTALKITGFRRVDVNPKTGEKATTLPSAVRCSVLVAGNNLPKIHKCTHTNH